MMLVVLIIIGHGWDGVVVVGCESVSLYNNYG